jgi:8-oxo-dGTP pyrophosphatase MutT (NUDIX family)
VTAEPKHMCTHMASLASVKKAYLCLVDSDDPEKVFLLQRNETVFWQHDVWYGVVPAPAILSGTADEWRERGALPVVYPYSMRAVRTATGWAAPPGRGIEQWMLPGGSCWGRDAWEVVQSEFREETGARVPPADGRMFEHTFDEGFRVFYRAVTHENAGILGQHVSNCFQEAAAVRAVVQAYGASRLCELDRLGQTLRAHGSKAWEPPAAFEGGPSLFRFVPMKSDEAVSFRWMDFREGMREMRGDAGASWFVDALKHYETEVLPVFAVGRKPK